MESKLEGAYDLGPRTPHFPLLLLCGGLQDSQGIFIEAWHSAKEVRGAFPALLRQREIANEILKIAGDKDNKQKSIVFSIG